MLDDDMCTEILRRLPLKSVTKFQLVCRRWFSIISTDHFRRLHTLGRPNPPPSLILNPSDSRFLHLYPIIQPTNPAHLTPFHINLPNNTKRISIVNSSNGLLLLKILDTYNDLFVYNPTTRQSRKLPKLPRSKNIIHVIQLHLVFDPIVSTHYKVVCVRVDSKPRFRVRPSDPLHRSYQMHVFDSNSGTWSVCGEPFTYSLMVLSHGFECELNCGGGVHCSNMIYGITASYEGHLYCFDMDTNALFFLPRPIQIDVGVSNFDNTPLLEASNGCLYYISLLSNLDGGRESVAVWKLQRDNDPPWLLKYHDRLSRTLLDGSPSNLLRFIVETSTLLIDVHGSIVAYDFRHKTYNELLDLKYKSYWDYNDMRLSYSKHVHHLIKL